MGWGDELMVAGEVKRRANGTARRFAIEDRRPERIRHRWNEIWQGNPRIAAPGEPFDEWYANHGGFRPNIANKNNKAWIWRAYEPEPGEIFFTESERKVGEGARGMVVVQPLIKAAASPNKNWGPDRWQSLIDSTPGVPWLQVGDGAGQRLHGAAYLQTRTFREACATVAAAKAAVLHEGGLHHAAAAVGTPSVVIFGGFVSPEVTGYKGHRNIFTGQGLGCGMRVPCNHCRECMRAIAPAKIARELEAIL